jgi:hypothetical protein
MRSINLQRYSLSCIIPTITYYSNKSGTPILIPLKLPHYLLCDSLTEVKGKALLCPGTFKFTSLKVNGIIQNIAIYSPISAKDYLSLNQNEDINLASLKYDSTNIIPFLTHFHTRRVQRGYYANVNSSTHKVFLKHGLNFNTDLVSYYEEIKDSNKVDKTSLPFYEYPNTIYIKLYTAECNLKEGKLEQPIFFNTVPSKENNYTTLTHVDLRVIDLNFMWNERQRKSTEPFPQSGYYSLTPEDTTFLEYYTHSPNIVKD